MTIGGVWFERPQVFQRPQVFHFHKDFLSLWVPTMPILVTLEDIKDVFKIKNMTKEVQNMEWSLVLHLG